ncbi:zf-HC2 domain-containing protein [Roseateles toxinivorans]|uniref:Putative zinc finger protein n=1 Tax=Roseateles toxinivorans TaxID=270368 RepID=A0A4V3CT44_9BURK|nr:zf-HC2 domain-containing protein [Roseateles toxinivorans]TDP63428.1 putative zinc finger protein [Roseateles toxinivorans]
MSKTMDADPNSAHRRAWDLIPWVVNGSASEDERRLVERHAEDCADCREEFDFQCQLRDGMAPRTAPAALDADHALGRFWGRVDAEQTGSLWDKLATQPPASPTAPAEHQRRGRWQTAMIAAVLVQALGLAALLGVLWERPRGAEYQVLSQPPAGMADIRLVPAPGLSLGELHALLDRHELQLLQANADATHFALGLRPGAGLGVAEAVQRLRAEPGVLLAEPLTPPKP